MLHTDLGARKLTKTSIDTDGGRTIAIGDIHGHADALRRLIAEIRPRRGDTIVPLGDYVNRGPDARGVIEALIELDSSCHLVPVLGNHDEMMLDARFDRYALDRFRHAGGQQTLDSYRPQPSIISAKLSLVPDSHWEFLSRCLAFYETQTCVFTHACYDPYLAMKDQPSSLLRWTSIDGAVPPPHVSGKLVVVGHTPNRIVRNYRHLICIDTGCGFGGRLTALEPATGTTWSVEQSGTAQDGDLQ
ncbi:Serine/threonine-protein phosphatase 1 [Rosistilla ulvae]|uniref:Serine/threonine-protein phosphatase 1 n=1 Tax=Rosistilla ulvae TaxID=1930277 RepID=A0A517LZP6_9BACT|nr:metallophosphoesterase family protein [Rosistilla ulvae]QDS88096.1 Serine/threonine-protein phosphatase 1 [Rosistilla ulvae]